MRVVCIDGVKIGDTSYFDNKADSSTAIYEGEIYTVIEQINHPGGIGYVLAERPPFNAYRKQRFVPLSSINETEMERNYNLQPTTTIQ